MAEKMTEAQRAQVAKFIADWWTERLMQGDKAAFHAALSSAIAAKLDATGERPFVRVECDYDPQDILLDAVRASGVECRGFMFSAKGILPSKRSVSVYPEREADPRFEQDAAPARVVVKDGYGNWSGPIPLSEIFAGRSALASTGGTDD